jgi:hypothetical protein
MAPRFFLSKGAWRHAILFFLNADCRQKEKKKGGDDEGRSSLMPKPNEILQQVHKMFHPP